MLYCFPPFICLAQGGTGSFNTLNRTLETSALLHKLNWQPASWCADCSMSSTLLCNGALYNYVLWSPTGYESIASWCADCSMSSTLLCRGALYQHVTTSFTQSVVCACQFVCCAMSHRQHVCLSGIAAVQACSVTRNASHPDYVTQTAYLHHWWYWICMHTVHHDLVSSKSL